MKFIKSAAVVALATGIMSASLFAGSTSMQSVTFAVNAINELAVTGTVSLTISGATAGLAPTDATATGSYAITTNEDDRKITAALDAEMPTGITLKVNLTAPANATSAGQIALGLTPVDVVSGISKLNDPNKSIAYTLSATPEAGVVPSGNRTITYTITAD